MKNDSRRSFSEHKLPNWTQIHETHFSVIQQEQVCMGELFGPARLAGLVLYWMCIVSSDSRCIKGIIAIILSPRYSFSVLIEKKQVAATSGFGVALTIFTTGPVSGAHLNPAVSIVMALFSEDFTWFQCLFYIIAQFFGSVIAGLVNYGVYGSAIARFEKLHGITRGKPGSERSAMTFGEKIFPNPDIFQAAEGESHEYINGLKSRYETLAVETLGTATIVLVIFALTDRSNKSILRGMEPFFIGFCVAMNILAPLSRAGFNPVRNFGPRLVAYFAGWNEIAIPGPKNWFWVYIVGPISGAVTGGAMSEMFLRRTEKECEKSTCR